ASLGPALRLGVWNTGWRTTDGEVRLAGVFHRGRVRVPSVVVAVATHPAVAVSTHEPRLRRAADWVGAPQARALGLLPGCLLRCVCPLSGAHLAADIPG